MATGALTVVGTGIRLITQLTPEARAEIELADRVFHVATEPLQQRWMEELNPSTESLLHLYQVGQERLLTYEAMVERVLAVARAGARVCFVLYGHPGVLVHPGHEAVRRARAEGIPARMLPGVSAEDCLFADLGVDPGARGCQTFEATDFLLYRRRFDPRSALVLFQIAVIGVPEQTLDFPSVRGLRALAAALLEHYPPDHVAIVYRAAEYPGCGPVVEQVTLAGLPELDARPTSTLYVPPLDQGEPEAGALDALRQEPR